MNTVYELSYEQHVSRARVDGGDQYHYVVAGFTTKLEEAKAFVAADARNQYQVVTLSDDEMWMVG